MNGHRKPHNYVFILTVLALFPSVLPAADWRLTTELEGSISDYRGSRVRKAQYKEAVFGTVDYLDSIGLTLGGRHSEIDYEDTFATVMQWDYFARLSKRMTFDAVPGIFHLRLDGTHIDNDDSTGASDRVDALEPRLSWVSYSHKAYADVGYARTSYPGDLIVHQITPTLGSSLGRPWFWTQVRGYFNQLSNSINTSGKDHTAGAEWQTSCWLPKRPLALWISGVHLNAFMGERLYAVDGDARSVYNFGDLQKASFSAGLEWRLMDSFKVLVVSGYQQYETYNLVEKYDMRFVHMTLKKEF